MGDIMGQQAAINGTTLYYDEKGAGTPLLFIHGMCGNANVWRDQMARLAGQFRCLSYDRRGHTRSPLGEIKERTVQLHADDAAALIRELALAPCILVGSSGGARVALDVVRRYPELIAGAVLSEPPLFALDQAGAKTVMGQLKPAIDFAVAQGGQRAAVDAFFDFMCPGLWQKLSESEREPYLQNYVELFGDLQMPTYQVTPEDLARIDRPCLVISGAESLPVLRNIAATLAAAIPGARRLELQGSGHVTYYEKPAEFAAAVASFAESVVGKAHLAP